MTPEREAEIRELYRNPTFPSQQAVNELLAEIDRLRNEYMVLELKCDEERNFASAQLVKYEARIDALKTENEKLAKDLFYHRDMESKQRDSSNLFQRQKKDIEQENKELLDKNEYLSKRPYKVHCPACQCEYANEAGLVLEEENQKLRERVANILQTIRDHAEGGNIEDYSILLDKLAQDDEEAKG